MSERIRRIVESKSFQFFILFVIVVAAVLVGVETYQGFASKHTHFLELGNHIVLGIFVIEAAMKMAQHGRHFYRYFRDPWNVFDFTIVVICFLPVNASYAAVLRLARIMRALRLMTAMPQLQIIVGGLIRSIPSMGYVGILLALNFYVYAVMGVFLFGKNDPVHFHDLQTAMLSLFRVVTLEDWTDVMYIQMFGSDVYAYDNTTGITPEPRAMPVIGALYFVSFVMFGTMIMLNLFIGVILNSMDEARAERERDERARLRAEGREPSVLDDVHEISEHLQVLQHSLESLQHRLEKGPGTDDASSGSSEPVD
jgi:voltage-gated sodium channel